MLFHFVVNTFFVSESMGKKVWRHNKGSWKKTEDVLHEVLHVSPRPTDSKRNFPRN